MTTVLWTSFAVVLVLLAIVVHEAAHALALRKLGFRITEAGLGLPFAPRLVLSSNSYVPFRLSLSPWVIAAYVTPDPDQEEEIEKLPYRDYAWFAGAGVIANFLFGGALFLAFAVSSDRFVLAGIIFLSLAVLWVFRKEITAYVLPVIGVPMLVWLGYLLATSAGEPQGPVGLGALLVSATLSEAVVLGMAVSISLGLMNLIPIYPFDGGRIADSAISRLAGVSPARWFRRVTGIAAGFFIAYVLVSDFVWLLF